MSLADLIPGPLPDGTRVGFHAFPEARGVLDGGTYESREVVLDGTGVRVWVKNADVFRVEREEKE